MNRVGHCWRCEEPCTPRCSRCRVAFYCSKKCQKQDKWRHRPNCDAAALKRQCMGCGKEDESMLSCSNCQRAWYCSAECQRRGWGNHKKQCRETVMKTIQVATKIKADRTHFRQLPLIPCNYYWGNMPAVDLLNLSMNEGEEYSNPLALLLCGVGDPRNVLLTIASLPDVYEQQVNFVLNDICPCTLARTVLLLYMLYKGKHEVVDTVIRVWYSLRISEGDFALLMSALEDLLAASDLSTLTNGFMNMATTEQLSDLKRVWQTWVQLSTLKGRWVTEKRKAAFERDSILKDAMEYYSNSIPKHHKESAKLWMENGLFTSKYTKASQLTRENMTLTGSLPLQWRKAGKQPDFDFLIHPRILPFSGWDYRAIENVCYNDSLPEMYSTYLSYILNKCVDKLRNCQVKLMVILCDCMVIESFLPVELKYDRITTSNLSDYLSLTALLTKFKEYLNTSNSHTVLVTEVHCWAENYLPEVIADMALGKFLEIAPKVCEDTNNPLAFLASLAEYYNYIPYFQLYLRAALIDSHSDEELDFLTKKNKLPSIKAIAATLGLELRDYVRNENTVFPFKWAVNCRRVNFKTGDEFTLEWKLPSSSQYLL